MEKKIRKLRIFAMLMLLQEIEQEALKTELKYFKVIERRPIFNKVIKFEAPLQLPPLQNDFFEIPKSKFFQKPKNNFLIKQNRVQTKTK